jgi:hypothetical protein
VDYYVFTRYKTGGERNKEDKEEKNEDEGFQS